MTDQKNIFIIIPAYNEEAKIAPVLAGILKKYKNIVVVDDCSSDKTYDIVKKIKVHILRHPINRGQGAALETGDQFAKEKGAEIIVHFDADGQFLVEDIEKLIDPLQYGDADIVMGSRFMGEESNMPFFKKNIIMPIARFVLRFLYKAKLTDPQNGFRAFNKKVINSLFIDNDGAAHCTEIIVKTLSNNWRYKEVPVTVRYNEFGQGVFSGKGRGTGGVKILKSLFMQKLIK